MSTNKHNHNQIKEKEKVLKKVRDFEKSPLSFFIRKRKLTFLVIVLLILVGIFQIGNLPKEREPEVEIPFGIVSTAYPGASPIDIEEQVTKEIESQIADLDGIEEISSSSSFGFSQIQVEFEADQDLDQSLRSLKDKVDEAKPQLPQDASDPNVQEFNVDDIAVLVFSLRGHNYDKSELKEYAKNLKDKLKSIQNVNKVEVIGGQEREIQVIANPEKLNELGLGNNSVIETIKAFNTNFPVGSVEINDYNYALRVQNQFQKADEIADLVVAQKDGRTIKVSDVAEVKETFEEVETISRISIEGDEPEESVSIHVYKRTGGDVTKVAEEARKIVNENKGIVYPNDVEIIVTTDTAEYTEDSINTLIENGVGTIIIILALLILFVGFRESVITSLAIPFSFFISFSVLAFTDQSLNGISLFSLVLALGLLVDSAMVIVEGMYEKINKHKTGGYEAAMMSVKEYSAPLTSGMLTTVAAFFPLLFVKGIMGEFMRVIPITVISTLVAALFVALTIVPAIGAAFLKPKGKTKNKQRKKYLDQIIQNKHYQYLTLILSILVLIVLFSLPFEGLIINIFIGLFVVLTFLLALSINVLKTGMERLIEIYDRNIERIINKRNKRIRILSLALAGLVISLMIPIISIIFPKIAILEIRDFGGFDAEQFSISIEMPEGTVLEETANTVSKVEDIVQELDHVENFVSSIGSGGENQATVTVNLVETEQREATSSEISDTAREKLKQISSGEATIQETEAGPPGGSPLEFRVAGDDLEQLETLSEDLKNKLDELEGTIEVKSDLEYLPGEFLIQFQPRILAQYGLNTAQVALELRNGIAGNDDLEILRQGEEIKIRISYPQDEVRNINELRNIQILTPDNQSIAVGELAQIKLSPSISSINRVDQKRAVRITGKTDEGHNPNEVMAQFKENIGNYPLPAGYEIIYGGETQELQEIYMDMFVKMLIGVILIIFILVTQFNSYRQTLIIVYTVPLAMIGVIWGMTISRLALDIPAFVGIISLWGIVVNDSIILIDQVNLNRKKGHYLLKAVTRAGKSRMQPILLTTATTVFGLLPLSIRDPNWRNMGFSIIFGLTFSTILVLVVVPTMYVNLYKFSLKVKENIDIGKAKLAKFWLRVVAFIIDLIIAELASILLIFVFTQITNLLLGPASLNPAVMIITNLILLLVYNVFMMYHFGTTLGKAFVEIRVVSLNKIGVDLKRIFLRETVKLLLFILFLGLFGFFMFSLSQYISNIEEFGALKALIKKPFPIVSSILFFGYLIIIKKVLLSKKRLLHDRLAKTKIIDANTDDVKIYGQVK
ncbi:MAG: MMPL family transporter [Candidatus Moranbacteria bacterium]|nr:MMPL family transporter [Candidatus Moranbacteria bacterium]